MFWSQVISLQMQLNLCNKRYYATQNCIWNKNTALFTGLIHKYGCVLNDVLLHDENTMVIIIKIHKSFNKYVLQWNTHVLVSVPDHLVSAPEQFISLPKHFKVFRSSYKSSGTLKSLP